MRNQTNVKWINPKMARVKTW